MKRNCLMRPETIKLNEAVQPSSSRCADALEFYTIAFRHILNDLLERFNLRDPLESEPLKICRATLLVYQILINSESLGHRNQLAVDDFFFSDLRIYCHKVGTTD